MNLCVTPAGGHRGWLDFEGTRHPCALGPAGIRDNKREGDGATPRGSFPLRRVLYRADRVSRPDSGLPVSEIGARDGWCDAPDDPAYNQQVPLPHTASAENLWRDDGVYDLLVVVGYNDAPVVGGRGSAIFLHVASPEFGPTEGCVALEIGALQAIVARLAPGDTIETRTS
ncbi:MAG: L,D-transpeptidase family protein [Alphaproteobacteria bacterium]|nr:L,D-transpeptidase family protein [Alphaproteobacteria bacterium]